MQFMFSIVNVICFNKSFLGPFRTTLALWMLMRKKGRLSGYQVWSLKHFVMFAFSCGKLMIIDVAIETIAQGPIHREDTIFLCSPVGILSF